MDRELMWVEKYRPKAVEDLVLTTEHRRLIKQFIKDGRIPHLLLVGQVGSGKTTVARILIDNLDCVVRELNASDERGIDTVRNTVKGFLGSQTFKKWKVCFMDEADSMCLDPNTEIMVVDSSGCVHSERLRDLSGELEVLSVNMGDASAKGLSRPIEVAKARVVDSGEAALYELELDNGDTVRCSADHPFFVVRDGDLVEMPLKDLKEGDDIVVAAM